MSIPAAGRRFRRRWIVIGVIVFVLFISVSSIVRFYTDMLWFDELGFTSVFWKILSTRLSVGVIAGLFAGIVVLLNLEVARRGAPRYRFVTQGTDVAEQYRSAFRPYARMANILLAVVVGLLTGLSTSAAWERWLLWRNARPFGVSAPQPFGHDVSFYVFGIPFQRSIISLLFGTVVASLLLAAVAHLLNGSIQPEANRIRVATLVKAHLSVLLGVIALLKAWSYRLDQYDLVLSGRGRVSGASYTDIHAQRPALQLLMIIAVVAAVIFFVNVFRFQSWLLPGAALALWAFSSILLGAIVPAAVQRFQVKPNESEKERPYIQRNIKSTRLAFGLDRVRTDEFPASDRLTQQEVDDNQGTVDNVRVWDPTVLAPTYQRLQAIRTYYEFDDIDIDRYDIDGKTTQVMLSGREVQTSNLSDSAQNWINEKLTYTHGYGAVANPANSVTSEGLPNFLLSDLPPEGSKEFDVDQPGIYFGEKLAPGSWSVVNSGQKEIDYPKGQQDVVTGNYKGKGGIALNNAIKRAAFSMRFGDFNLMISSLIKPESKVIMRRNIRERVEAAAPFLQYDADPYLVIADKKQYWVLDGYTSTNRYPYGEPIDMAQVGLQGEVNYLRNSVKVVVDAYDGTTTFYMWDPSDALAATYQAAFPNLFTPKDRMPKALQAHMRYPEGLFKVQTLQYRSYHINDAQRLYEREDVWDVPADPVHTTSTNQALMQPYYVVMKLPGEDKEEFLLMLPFNARGRQNMSSWVAARMDGEHYGELVSFTFPRGDTVDGPGVISSRIEQNEVIAEQTTLWDRSGSSVQRGNLLVIPIGKSLIYVRPFYLQSENQEGAVPELRRVAVVVGDRIGFESSFQKALDAAMTGTGPTLEGETPSAPSEEPTEQPQEPAAPSGDVAALLSQAVDHFAKADAALRDGDLATYQRENEAGKRAVEEAQRQSR